MTHLDVLPYALFNNFPMGLKNKINKLVNEAIPIENREEIVQSIIQRIAQDGNFDNKYESISDLIGQIHRLPFNGLQKNYTKLNQDLYIEIKEFDDVKSNIETLAKAYRREYSIFTYEDIIKDSVGNELNIFGSNSHGLANKSQPGLLLKTIMELYTFGPLIAFWEAEKFLTGANIQTFMDFSPDKRKNYTDPYFNFSMDLSNLVLVFIFTDIKKLPNIFKHTMMEMPYNAPSRTTPDIIPSAQIETVSLTQHFPGTSQSNIIKLPLNTKNLERIPNVILGFSIESTNSLQEGNLNEDLYTESMLIFDLNSTESYPFEKKDFEEIDCIYRGRGSTVTIVKHTPTNRVAVIKKIQIQKTEHSLMQHKPPKNEIEILKKVTRHENIVDLYGVHESSTHIMLCMEYMNASLRRVFMKIHESQKIFPELLLGGVSVKILNALNFCYQEKLIHRDIKPDNILINWTGEIKLSDFGESRFMIDSQVSTNVGTPLYFAPERCLGGKYDIRSDIWSLGITLIECILGKYPFDLLGISYNSDVIRNYLVAFEQIKAIEPINLIAQCSYKFPNTYSSGVYSFLLLILEKKYEKRPSYNQIMEATFYKDSTKILKEEIVSLLQEYKEE